MNKKIYKNFFISDENTKLPYIAPVSKHDRERDNNETAERENNQFIISLNMEDWQVCHTIRGLLSPYSYSRQELAVKFVTLKEINWITSLHW